MKLENDGLADEGRGGSFYQPSHLRQEPEPLTALAAALAATVFIASEWGWRKASISASSSLMRARASSRYFSRERFARMTSSPCVDIAGHGHEHILR